MIMINREDELNILDEVYSSSRAELVLIYGRRRVGKSRLLVESIKNRKDALYLLADMSDNILENLAGQVPDRFVRFGDWEDFFEFILKCDQKIIIIDEFQYLYNIDHAWPSLLQRWWETIKVQTNKKIILCGSMMSTIYRISRGYGSALYGRRTRDIRLQPMRFKNAIGFLEGYDIEDMIRIYSILGGVPRYLEEIDPTLSFRSNLSRRIMDRSSFLYNEPMNLMFEEFKDPSPYISIIQAITGGHRRFNDISIHSRITTSSLPKYLTVMERIDIIRKENPIAGNQLRSKKSLYFVSDNFYRFWFRFMFPNRYQFELGFKEEVEKAVIDGLDDHIGRCFEEICSQVVIDMGLIRPQRIGRQWGTIENAPKGRNTYEIDIMAQNSKEVLFAECKWGRNVDAKQLLDQLRTKSMSVDVKPGKKIKYLLFARGFKNKLKDICYDIEDLQDFYKNN